MRIVAGKHKGRQLKAFKGRDIRPTSDKVKEAVFNIIGEQIIDSKVLDLFSGSGNLGLECISRGADNVIFVEKNRKAVDLIRSNLSLIGEWERAQVLSGDVFRCIKKMSSKHRFDIVFVDPPYKEEVSQKILDDLHNFGILSNGAVVVYETNSNYEFGECDGHYELIKYRIYGSTKITFFRYKWAI